MSSIMNGGYKSKLQECLRLRGEGGLSAYRRARLLCDVFEDREFRADLGNADDLKMASALDEYVEDLCLDFLDLRAMVAFAPNESQWMDGRLKRLHAEMLAAQSQATSRGESKKPRKAATVKQLEAAEKRVEELSETARHYRSEVEELRSKLSEATDEIRRLQRENARLEGRISELERLGKAVAA